MGAFLRQGGGNNSESGPAAGMTEAEVLRASSAESREAEADEGADEAQGEDSADGAESLHEVGTFAQVGSPP